NPIPLKMHRVCGLWCTLNLTLWVKSPSAGMLLKIEEGMPVQVSSSSSVRYS
ncbi:hypothetical protein AVEN_178911-1, partial [Araneus ventricosus]